MNILFSPVGGTDPISMSNYHDGSLLHIIRNYHPEVVLLYMSDEIYCNHILDNRYLYCIEKLNKLHGIATVTAEIEKTELGKLPELIRDRSANSCCCFVIRDPEAENVFEYNTFIAEFSREIADIQSVMTPEDELLLNTSSGTPAMKSALLVLATMLDYRCRLIQVTTPVKGMNEHVHKGYDVTFLWEADEDNEKTENRCREVNFKSLTLLKYENILRDLIHNYDYQGALDVCRIIKKINPKFDERSFEMAYQRQLLNIPEASKIASDLQLNIFPVRSGEDLLLFEYAANLFIKTEKGEYADFIRGLTPLILPLFVRVLKCQSPEHIDIRRNYTRAGCSGGNQNDNLKWEQGALNGTELQRVFDQCYDNFRYGYVESDHIKNLIVNLCADPQLTELVESIRSVEGSIRNMAAHEMISVTPEKIQRLTGFTYQQIIGKVKAVFPYAGVNVKAGCWNTYQDMNNIILGSLANSK